MRGKYTVTVTVTRDIEEDDYWARTKLPDAPLDTRLVRQLLDEAADAASEGILIGEFRVESITIGSNTIRYVNEECAHRSDGYADARETFEPLTDAVPTLLELMSDSSKRESLMHDGETDVDGAMAAWAQGYRAAALEYVARAEKLKAALSSDE